MGVSSEPATKQDLADAVQQIDEGVSLEIANTVDKVSKAIRDSHAEILRAFAEIARSVDLRLSRLDELAPGMGRLEARICQPRTWEASADELNREVSHLA